MSKMLVGLGTVILLLALVLWAAAGFDTKVAGSWLSVGQDRIEDAITHFLGEADVQMNRARQEIAGLVDEKERLVGVLAAATVDLRAATELEGAVQGQIDDVKTELREMQDLVASGQPLADGNGRPLSVADAEAILASKLAGLEVLQRREEVLERTVAAYDLTISRATTGVRTLEGEIAVQSEKLNLLSATYSLVAAYNAVPDASSRDSLESKIAQANGVIDEMIASAQRNAVILQEMRSINTQPSDVIQSAASSQISPALLAEIEAATR